MKYWRIFWYCELTIGGDGYYYYRWINYVFNIEREIFAGYNRKALRTKRSTFNDIRP